MLHLKFTITWLHYLILVIIGELCEVPELHLNSTDLRHRTVWTPLWSMGMARQQVNV